ncbi:hypothetical protein KUTeg_018244 [Tegillarca granosa]|uniref:Uncharacterized protein n=1 Tax=Tegillarca granosa TaxID=220873 RepID=A0ABQ9ELB3_TEGGR|nr:hypothetical protein KUTeg_018244 [Tegillarca granosa]
MLGANRFSRSTSSLKRPASGNSARSVTLQEPVNFSKSSIASGLNLTGGFTGTGNDCLRDIDFNDDDTVTYVSSTTMREIFPELETIPVRDNPGENMQAFYDSPVISLKTPRKNLFADNDIMMSSPRSSILSNPMRRSRSLSKLNGSFTSQDFSPPPVVSPFHKPLDRSIRHLKDNLEDSENRRAVLMHKLKEAQDTLELQSNRLGKIENTAKGNTFLVEDLKLKEREYREKIKDLEKGRDEKDLLKIENIRLREEMQDRIDKLDFQLRSLQAQHQVVENENQKRISLLDQSSTALSMLEDENSQIKKLMELRKLTQSMKDENEKLALSWKSVTEEKQSVSRQLEGAQNKLADLKTKASSASTEKDKLFQEKLDLNNKFQQLLINKEQLERAKCELEEQLYHQEGEAERIKKSMKKKEEEKNKKEEKIYEMDKMKAYTDEVRQLRNDRTTLENKIHELETKLRKANEDIKKSTSRGQQELDTWKDTCDRLTASVSRKEAEIQDLQDKCLDNEDLIAKQQEELRTLKDECDRLSEQHEDIKKLKDENRKMHQEKAENEQMIKLLETQKEVLAQSTEHQLAKLHDAEHLTGKVEQLRNDKEQLRERVLELEKVRDNLIRQKEELLASSELIYKKPKLEELESKIEELREANRQLRDINENINERYEALEEENYHMKQAMGEKDKIKILEKEKDGLEKQVALINGQLLLVESSKKRLDEVVEDLQYFKSRER